MTTPKPGTPLAAIAYYRYSEEGQSEYSIPAQRDAVQKAAPGLGYTIVAEFADEGVSGLRSDRPGFQAAISAARAEAAVAAILVHKFDRFSRDSEHQAVFRAALKRDGVRLVSIAEPTDDSPAGFLTERIMDAMAAYYSLNLSHEAKKGLSQRRKQGRHCGSAPLGYHWKACDARYPTLKSLVIEPQEARVVRAIYRLAEQGFGTVTIARRMNERGYLGKWGSAWTNTVRVMRTLRNPTYAALIASEPKSHRVAVGGKRIDHHRREWEKALVETEEWLPIIERERWRRIQAILDRRARTMHPASPYLLTGLLKCPVCGENMWGSGGGTGGSRYYRCSRARLTHPSFSLPAPKVEAAVIEALAEAAGNLELVAVAPAQRSAERLEDLRDELRGLRETMTRLEDAYLAGQFDLATFRDRKRLLVGRIEETEQALSAPVPAPKPPSKRYLRETIRKLRSAETPVVERRRRLSEVFVSVTPRQDGGLDIILRDRSDLPEDASPAR
ncbi:MAG: recombinase family protein [bacterium]